MRIPFRSIKYQHSNAFFKKTNKRNTKNELKPNMQVELRPNLNKVSLARQTPNALIFFSREETLCLDLPPTMTRLSFKDSLSRHNFVKFQVDWVETLAEDATAEEAMDMDGNAISDCLSACLRGCDCDSTQAHRDQCK